MADSPESQDLSEVGLAYARAFSDDLRALVGTDVSLKGPIVATESRNEAIVDDATIAHTVCHSKENSDLIYHVTVPASSAITIACLLMGHGEERIKEMREQPLDEETLDAFGEVMNLATAVLSRIFTDQYQLPPLGVVSLEEVDSPQIDNQWLDAGEYAVARFKLQIPGFEDGPFVLLFPHPVAKEWFGIQLKGADGDEDGRRDAGEYDEDQIEPTSIVFIDPSEDSRNDIEDLEDELGHSVWTLDPDEFDPDELDEFSDVGAFFIEWNMEIRTGVDFLETLRCDERTVGVPILMMSEEPTDGRVRAAIRSGANSFVSKPIDLEEVNVRLNPLLLARQKLAAGKR